MSRARCFLQLLCIALVVVSCGRAAGGPQAATLQPTATMRPPTATLQPTSQVTATTAPQARATAMPVQERVPLVVFAAGSLIIPFDALEKAFEERHPGIDVQAEYHGSIQVIRHVAELHEAIDVVATADAALLPMLMYVTNDPQTGKPYADWYIRFASNRLAVAYTLQSRRGDEITVDNWPEVLSDPGVRVGLSDPRFDALGYRALMAFALLQEQRQEWTLFQEMFKGRFVTPVTLFYDDDEATITVPEIVETRPETGLILRGASIQLIALLQSGDIDYAFEYESVIQQHGLEMLRLPDEINLGAAGMEEIYGQVVVDLDFRRFATIQPRFRGERIGYGITIPSNAPHPEEAAAFIAFLLGPEGRALMDAYYHPMFDPAIADGYPAVPQALQMLCVPEETP